LGGRGGRNIKRLTTLTYKGSPESVYYPYHNSFHIQKNPQKKMTLQETRVWAIQQLLQKEGKLYTHMYECAQIYAETWGEIQDLEKLYKSWECFTRSYGRIPNNRL